MAYITEKSISLMLPMENNEKLSVKIIRTN